MLILLALIWPIILPQYIILPSALNAILPLCHVILTPNPPCNPYTSHTIYPNFIIVKKEMIISSHIPSFSTDFLILMMWPFISTMTTKDLSSHVISGMALITLCLYSPKQMTAVLL